MKKELTHVLNFDGRDIVSDTIDTSKLLHYYNVTLPFSLDLKALDNQFNVIESRKILNKDKQYTDALINVTFRKTIKRTVNGKTVVVMSTDAIREKLYEEGFLFNDEKYVLYKRSASKAKNGSVLFIKQKYYDYMIKWTDCGMIFEKDEKVDLASLMAYRSLTMSGLVDTISIPPHQIVIIDERYSDFSIKASVTDLLNNKPVTADRKISQSNNIWDGMALLDSTIFNKAKLQDRSSIQLRNKYLKCMAFNTNIYSFLHNQNVDVVTDIFGTEFKIKDVKLVITKSCLKLFKFAYKFKSTKDMYDSWLSSICSFGYCKSEHETVHGYDNDNPINQLSYQMINSMKLSKKDINSLVKFEINYINALKNDLEIFKKHIELNDRSIARQTMLALVQHNSEFQDTKIFKNYRQEEVKKHINKVKRGKVRFTNSDYCVLCANPLEMLYALANKEPSTSTQEKLLTENEVYTKLFDDNEELAIFRSPHICKANILYSKNKQVHMIDKYFNFNQNIIVINNIASTVTQRLQGSDQDGDTCLVSNNSILVREAKSAKDILIPINNISFKLTERKYNNNAAYLIDREIAKNYIGRICNLSQKVNSMLVEKQSKKLLDVVSQLSSLSQIEIDKSKKYYSKDDLNITQILSDIKNENKVINPFFFKFVNGSKKELVKTKCSMDILHEVIDEKVKDKQRTDNVEFVDLLTPPLNYTSHKANKKQIKLIEKCCVELDKKIASISAEKGIDNRTKINRINLAKEYAFEKVVDLKINEYTMYNILLRIENDKNIMSKNKRSVLQALFIDRKRTIYKLIKKCSLKNDKKIA